MNHCLKYTHVVNMKNISLHVAVSEHYIEDFIDQQKVYKTNMNNYKKWAEVYIMINRLIYRGRI